jgi:D-tyrosyl-tRNA(Tyr) deacylase
MRAVVQRVAGASVSVDGRVVGSIGKGLCVFIGVAPGDGEGEVEWMAGKIANLRIFEDAAGKMNLSLLEEKGAMLVVSQFTLYGDCRKGRRPSFASACEPERANSIYEDFIRSVSSRGIPVATGVFQASMRVEIHNDGPVTLILDTEGVC